ncbi:protein secretion protein [Virgibacillus profundi]|uniref:peptidylprolyl isomerase n=1 Tax=Virgibacillus profundi TaxID=2024555 RepID=A0A2A2IBY1_9BACI|nr:peptidylprolyl isomerase [Virgibacillus profundi]PAV28583.1 protein secretion protein [Virgibacillus profundi]PXY51774.1 protein secretion protein [Virgibacillus profundi]
MSKKLLLGIIIVLVITNIASLLFWNKEETVGIDDGAGTGTREINSKEPVASIDDEEISYQDWMEALRSTHGEKQMKMMIDRAVVKQLAEENNIEVHDKVIEREIALLTSMQGVMKEEEFAKKQEKWREEIIYRYQLEQLLTMDTQISEEEIQTYYNEYKNQYDFTASMQLSHIIVQNFDTAEKVIKELGDGASFDLLAQEYSLDEESKKDGGYLGFIKTTSQFFPNGYEEVAMEMEEDSYSEAFAADNGIAIIYLHRKLPSIEFTYGEIKAYVKSELALHETDQSLTANPLWEKLDIEWLYDE